METRNKYKKALKNMFHQKKDIAKIVREDKYKCFKNTRL